MHKNWRVSVTVLSVGLSGVFAASASAAPKRASRAELAERAACYDISQDQHSQTRQTFLEMLKDPETDSQSIDGLVKMLRSYRLDPVADIPQIQDGPFVGYVIDEQVVENWAALYDAQYESFLQTYASDSTTYEAIYDLAMQAVEAHALPASLESLSAVGSCLAQRIEEGANDKKCRLDNSDELPEKPSILTMAWMKYTCFVPIFTSPCSARKKVFNYAKAELIEAKKENLIGKYAPQFFPAIFNSSIIGGANQIRGDLADFVSGKFDTRADDDYWEAPLIDIQDTRNHRSGISEFAAGLSADIRAASVLEDSHPEISAPLLYAAANRLLVLAGGPEAVWDPQQKKFAMSQNPSPEASPGPSPSPSPSSSINPGPPPSFVTDHFGGFGFAKDSSGEEVEQIWDPEQTYSPPPLRLIPSWFTLGANNVPEAVSGRKATESMVDLGNLMNALMDFMELTGPDSKLASHFVDVNADPNASSRITQAGDPALFPRQGRQLATMMIAAIVQNMIAPNGHVVIPDPSSLTGGPTDEHSGVLGVRYYNQIDLSGREDGKVPTVALAGVFGAAARFSALAAQKDRDIPPAMLQFKSQIDQAVDVSMLSMIGRSQQADGGFVDNMGDPASSERNLDTQVAALGALTTVYSQDLEPAQLLAIGQAWLFLDHFWPKDSDLPISAVAGTGEPAPDATGLSAASAWGLLNLWTQTQASPVYAELNPTDVPAWGKDGWDQWQTRFDTLRKQLQGQLDSDQGPQPLPVGQTD